MIPFVVTLQVSRDNTSGVATRIVHAATKNIVHAMLQRQVPKYLQPGEAFEVLNITSLYELQEYAG